MQVKKTEQNQTSKRERVAANYGQICMILGGVKGWHSPWEVDIQILAHEIAGGKDMWRMRRKPMATREETGRGTCGRETKEKNQKKQKKDGDTGLAALSSSVTIQTRALLVYTDPCSTGLVGLRSIHALLDI